MINYIGRKAAEILNLPAWFDSVGTVIAAYVYGPVCGAIAGAAVNIMYSIHVKTAVFYALTNAAVGFAVGICAKKGYLNTLFGAMSTAFSVAALSTLISTPLNYIFAGGSTGNQWGDGTACLFMKLGLNSVISHILGEFYLDFLDKVLVIMFLYLVVQNFKKKKLKGIGVLWIPVFLVFMLPETTSAKELNTDYQRYVQTVYARENGLLGGEANDIARTKDGVLWIGTYGGLYRYSGSRFQLIKDFPSVKNVNCLYTDVAGRLWIGTNDGGLSICINQEISNIVNKDNGLPSDSVHCITESANGCYYVGTTDGLVIMTLSGGLRVQTVIPEITYADSISADADGNVAVVTEAGELYLVRGSEILAKQSLKKEGKSYHSCAFDASGILYAGTSGNSIEVYQIREDSLWKASAKSCNELQKINALYVSEDNKIFICADNGAGYLDEKRSYHVIDTGNFNSSIESMLVDYQGNLWFASSRSGLLRLCPSAFTEIYEEADIPEQVVNTVTGWGNRLYFGTDHGIDVIDPQHNIIEDDPVAQIFQGARVRCLFADSRNHLWVCTFGRGLWEINKDGTAVDHEEQKGTSGEKFRFVTELNDHTIVAGGDGGITFIKDGNVYDTIGEEQGLKNQKVLSVYENYDGSLYAGTDGNGIAVIRDHKVTEILDRKNGLSSEIILRMIPDKENEGLFIVTGSGLCYQDAAGKIRYFGQFPYYNNYDLVEGRNGELFVLGSAGIYVADKEELLSGKKLNYELLDVKQGLRLSLTPNAWNYTDDAGNLYLSGDRGVVSINLEQYDIKNRSYRMLLQKIKVDSEQYAVEKGETITIPQGANTIELLPEIVNYSINDPKIQVYLEGFDRSPKEFYQSSMNSVVYTNLPSGDYTFHVAVLDTKGDRVMAETTYPVKKEHEIYENWWFQLYAAVVSMVIILYLGWMFFRTQIQKTIKLQRMELEWTKKQLQMGNETILTIAQAVDAKDVSTSKHSLRVADYSALIAKELGYSRQECEDLRKMALLHDIGKIAIPDRVLNKPERLTEEEYVLMQSHVKKGAEILKNFTLIDHVADGALYHHERYDGSGYLYGLKGDEIPLNARIIGIADAFDAMTANRIYRKQMDMEYVLNELKKGRGTQFDPQLTDIFLKLLENGTIDVLHMYTRAEDKEQEDET